MKPRAIVPAMVWVMALCAYAAVPTEARSDDDLIPADSLTSSDPVAMAAGAAAVYRLEPVRVLGERVERLEADEVSSLTVSVIDPTDHPAPLRIPARLLAEVPGCETRRQGWLGAFSTASLRGSAGNEVAVFLDGLDLRSPFSGLALLDELPLVGLGRIEVYRGGVPGELGGAAPAGVINVVTDRDSPGSIGLAVGSYGTRRGAVSLGARGPWGIHASLQGAYLGSDADFSYLDRRGTVISNTADDTLRVRHNSDLKSGDLLLRLTRPPLPGLVPGELDLSYRYLKRENGIPGSTSLPCRATRSRRSSHDSRLVWISPLLGGNLRLHTLGYYREGWNRFLNPDDEQGPFLVTDETRDHLKTSGYQGKLDLYLPPLHLLVRGERRRDRFLPENLNPRKGKGFARHRTTEQLEGEGRLLLWGDRFLVSSNYGEKWVTDNYHGSVVLPWLPPEPAPPHDDHGVFRLTGLRLRVLERQGEWGRFTLNLRGNSGHTYRVPTLLELFGQDVTMQGNAELRSEQSDTRDGGVQVEWRWRGVSGLAGITWYRRDLEDQILFLRNSQYTIRPQNISASRMSGREMNLSLTWRMLDLSLAATRQYTSDLSGLPEYQGKSLPYRTPFHLFTRLQTHLGVWDLFAELDRRDETFTDRYNEDDLILPASRIWNGGLSYHFSSGLDLSLELVNLTDQPAQDILGYPLPGRTWICGLEWILGSGAESDTKRSSDA